MKERLDKKKEKEEWRWAKKKKNLGIGKESGEEKRRGGEKKEKRKRDEEYKKAGVEIAETPFQFPPRAGGEAMLQHAVEHRNQT